MADDFDAAAMAAADAAEAEVAEVASVASTVSFAAAGASSSSSHPASPAVAAASAAAAAATKTASSASEAAAATRLALKSRFSDADMQRARKQAKLDGNGINVTGFIWTRSCKPGDNSALWLTTVVVPQPRDVSAAYVELDTFEYVPRNEKKTNWFWKPPVTENAKFRFFYDTTMVPIKEGFGSPINENLRPGQVVDIIGLRYERSWNRPNNEFKFALTASEIRASKTKLAELANVSKPITELLQLNGTLASEAVRAYDEDFVRIMGVRDDYNMNKIQKSPDDPYAVCRRVFVLPIDQGFVETEAEYVSSRRDVVATFFDAALQGEKSYVGKMSVADKKEDQRIIRVAISDGESTTTGAVPFLVKQLRFGSGTDAGADAGDAAFESTMMKVHMPIYAEKLLVVPKREDWVGVGPVLAAGMVGAFAVTPKNRLVMENDDMPNMAVYGSLVWDLARTVQNVGIEVPTEFALQIMNATAEQDIVGKPLDETPRTIKDSKDRPLPLLHVAPLTDCVNMAFFSGNITRLVVAAAEQKAKFMVVASFLKFESLEQLKGIQTLPWPERRTRYESMVEVPAGKKQQYHVFALAPNVMTFLDATLA